MASLAAVTFGVKNNKNKETKKEKRKKQRRNCDTATTHSPLAGLVVMVGIRLIYGGTFKAKVTKL